VSTPYAIAGLTATLQYVLNDGLGVLRIPTVVSSVIDVKAVAPDLVIPTGGLANPALNIFLYRITPNTGWCNFDLASRNSSGDRLTNPPMALDLHYMLSAYADDDLHAEMILGGAMHILHEMPGIDRNKITDALTPLDTELRNCGLADQIEHIKITPEYQDFEEVSKIWSAIQSNYRPSVVYQVTVVLVQSEEPKRSALPVLQRGQNDIGATIQANLIPPVPTITSIEYPDLQLSANINSTIKIHGHMLDGNNVQVVFTHSRLDEPPQTVAVIPANVSATQLTLQLPNDPLNWAAGIYSMEVQLNRPGETYARVSNSLPFILAPSLSTFPPNPPASIARAGSEVTVVVECSPEIRPNQTVSLILGQYEAYAEPHPSNTNLLTFVFEDLAPNSYPVRLRVGGAESWLVDRTENPPTFYPSQSIDVPA
jgi:hypothetical protein